MALPQTAEFITPEEYLERERTATTKSEYFAGEIFGMAGGSPTHSLICANVLRELGTRLKGKRCTPYESNLRLRVETTGLYTYPDVSVVCSPLEFSDEKRETVINPTLLVEVLSDSTEAYDRGAKFEHYRSLPTLMEYVLISQKAASVEVFTRETDGAWRMTPVQGMEAKAVLRSLEVEIPLSEIYYRVEFPAAPSLKPAV